MQPSHSRHLGTALSIALLTMLSLAACGSSGSVIRLSEKIEKQAKDLQHAPVGANATFEFSPTRSADTPFSVVMLPNRQVTESELVAAGVAEETAARIFDDLAYVNVQDGGMMVLIEQNERLRFTSHWNHYAKVDDVLLLSSEGSSTHQTTVSMQRTSDGVVVAGANMPR